MQIKPLINHGGRGLTDEPAVSWPLVATATRINLQNLRRAYAIWWRYTCACVYTHPKQPHTPTATETAYHPQASTSI